MSPDPAAGEAVRSTATSLLVLSLIGVVIVVTLVLVVVLRRGRRLRDEARRREPSGTGPDAWAESGRRAATPGEDEL